MEEVWSGCRRSVRHRRTRTTQSGEPLVEERSLEVKVVPGTLDGTVLVFDGCACTCTCGRGVEAPLSVIRGKRGGLLVVRVGKHLPEREVRQLPRGTCGCRLAHMCAVVCMPTCREGDAPPNQSPGPVHVMVSAAPHARFSRRGSDLVAAVKLPLHQALTGGVVSLQMLDGR